MDLTYSDVQAILKIIDAAEHLDEIELVHGGFRLHVVRNGAGGATQRPAHVVASGPAPSAGTSAAVNAVPVVAPEPARTSEPALPPGTVAIRAPMLGTFYRASAPGERPFVEVGQRVRADDTVCLIEVMKLFNSIRAGVDGEVVQILAENGALVEHNQVLIVIASKAKG
ncbi:MAG: acetyl-CoA carboxylase biotin carboxyl carrier protein [Hyphomicrobiaceae bacterium]|nr:MAG: acetyl-CoA carboxylase biotin carboxyl carrier protein [Hyphomicrobiaceae bacterium]